MRLELSKLLTREPINPQWLIKGMIPSGTVVMVAGDAGIGKTVLNVYEAFCLATGKPFLGHDTTQTRCLYFDEENSQPDALGYLQQVWLGLGCPDLGELDAWFRYEHFSLTRDWVTEMGSLVREFKPGMIYVDTATSALHIAEENDNAEAQRLVTMLRRVMAASGVLCSLKVIKHAKFQSKTKDLTPKRTIRGAKAWLGAVDQTMYHIGFKGAPDKQGLRPTALVPAKSRAFGLKENIRITPSYTTSIPKGLILKAEPFHTTTDLMEVHEQ